nr:unnamed protein product [Callosobruchus chinensis]
MRPSLECCSHIWGAAAPTTLSILDVPLSHQRAVGDLSLFYHYSNGFCSSELTSIIPPLSKPARWTRGTSSHPKAIVLHIHQEPNDTIHLCPQGVQGLEWTDW